MSRAGDWLAANLWDAAALGVINGYQLRRRAGRLDRAAWRRYTARWSGAHLSDFYALPEAAWHLPTTPQWSGPSPHPVGVPANDRQILEFWPGPEGPQSPWMIMLHGLMSSDATGYRRWALRLNKLGCGAVFCHLPFHYDRTPPGTVSGELALSAQLILALEGLRQAVIELRCLIRGLTAAGAPWVGVWGTSYGAWIGAMASLLEPVETAWLLEPVVDVGWTLWRSPVAAAIRWQLRAAGLGPGDLAPLLPLTCPGEHQPAIRGHRLLLLSGRYDRIAPTWLVRRFGQQWQAAHVRELDQGHLGFRMMPACLDWAPRLMPDLFGSPGRGR